MLDIHTHILPGMDDGSKNAQQSVSMLSKQMEQGVYTVALTPHYLAHQESPESFLRRRMAAGQELEAALAGTPGHPALLYGAEVAYFDGMCRSEDTELLCLGNTRAMLIEMPFCKWSSRMLGELRELRQLRGIQPVLAHVERYRRIQPAGLMEELSEGGMLLQVNTSFLLNWQTAWKAVTMLRKGIIHFLASDCHDLVRRPPNLGMALEKMEHRLGRDGLAMLAENKNRLLGG